MQNLNAKPLTYFILTMTRRGRCSYQPYPTDGFTRVEREQPSHPRLHSQQVVEAGHEPHVSDSKVPGVHLNTVLQAPRFPEGRGLLSPSAPSLRWP